MSEQFSATPPKKKPGPTPKATLEQVEELENRIQALEEAVLARESVEMPAQDRTSMLESALGKIAHYVGGQVPRICREFGISVWEPERKDMHRF